MITVRDTETRQYLREFRATGETFWTSEQKEALNLDDFYPNDFASLSLVVAAIRTKNQNIEVI